MPGHDAVLAVPREEWRPGLLELEHNREWIGRAYTIEILIEIRAPRRVRFFVLGRREHSVSEDHIVGRDVPPIGPLDARLQLERHGELVARNGGQGGRKQRNEISVRAAIEQAVEEEVVDDEAGHLGATEQRQHRSAHISDVPFDKMTALWQLSRRRRWLAGGHWLWRSRRRRIGCTGRRSLRWWSLRAREHKSGADGADGACTPPQDVASRQDPVMQRSPHHVCKCAASVADANRGAAGCQVAQPRPLATPGA